MSDIFFTSDLHLNHNKGFIYEHRGFSNCHEHSLGIIDNINQVVKEDDELYILGDVMLEDDEKGLYYFNRIKCHNIHIILGNHDSDKRIEIFKSLDNVKELCFATRIKLKKWTCFLFSSVGFFFHIILPIPAMMLIRKIRQLFSIFVVIHIQKTDLLR